MFLDSLDHIVDLASANDFSIFVTKDSTACVAAFPKKHSLRVSPNSNGKITIEQIREVIDFCVARQSAAFFIVITDAEKLTEQAENALLKLLEEPPRNYHFVLQVADASALLETVLSRGNLYIVRIKNSLSCPVSANSTQRLYAKRIIFAKPAELPELVKQLSLEKDYKKDARGFTLQVVSTAIEMLYKSFFVSHEPKLIKKLSDLLTLYDNLMQNGHIKLHLVADLC